MNREQLPTKAPDPRVLHVLQGLAVEGAGVVVSPGVPLNLDYLRQNLVWNERCNMAALPTNMTNWQGERLSRFLVTHATNDTDAVKEPQLRFADRPPQHRTQKANVYGTGLYVANQPGAALRASTVEQGRQLNAYLTDALAPSVITDRRRRFIHDVAHLVGMTVTEKVLPRVLGQERTAASVVNRADRRWRRIGAKLILLNEAPRGRIEKMPHEAAWGYDVVPPQYALLRAPMTRVGTYGLPAEQPRTSSTMAMYGKLFWQAAWRNGRDAKRAGVPWWR